MLDQSGLPYLQGVVCRHEAACLERARRPHFRPGTRSVFYSFSLVMTTRLTKVTRGNVRFNFGLWKFVITMPSSKRITSPFFAGTALAASHNVFLFCVTSR